MVQIKKLMLSPVAFLLSLPTIFPSFTSFLGIQGWLNPGSKISFRFRGNSLVQCTSFHTF